MPVKIRKQNQDLLRQKYMSIKTLSLNNLTAKQHMLMALCRDVSLLPPSYYTFTSLRRCINVMMDSPYVKLYEPQSFRDTLTRFWQTYMLYNNLTEISSAALLNSSHMSSSSFSSSSSSSSSLSTVTSTTSAIGAAIAATQTFADSDTPGNLVINSLVAARASEYLFCAIWCLVALYLSYAILDSLMVRWIVKYSTVAAILRMFSMSLIFVSFELLLLNSLSPENNYFLHTWILISCILTCGYIWQSYLTSDLNYIRRKKPGLNNRSKSLQNDNLNNYTDSNTTITDSNSPRISNSNSDSDSDSDSDDTYAFSDDNDDEEEENLQDSTRNENNHSIPRRKKKKNSQNKLDLSGFKFTTKRTIDLYNIIVFCVVPVGLASFITMVGLLRNLFIQRLDVEQLARIIQESVH
ncbi:Eos1p [Maudiozyma barnettii]|uniref:Similar to Saccharomyces cerevisiae YNL080C EOS1 Protein involved in N-glycosylation n=1 Tax=Maudiozyma barnettii TaxID=61262 RepID=A0A8H2VC59_9SACH|nr:Eos1p [Kazachstania barnettii]CAB4252561.1 similar to Saccharomyces cerevisiae YNL080C EOS1 Protein involved in N-glycosylation [Kazachstania barnettii]